MYLPILDTDSIQSATERRTKFTALLNQNACIEWPTFSLVEEETPLPSSGKAKA
jgi:hypothetical protein